VRELDPRGDGRLLERLVAAYARSVAQLLPQLQAAPGGTEAALVAHTLKSSSATLGAVRVAQLCSEIETLSRQGRRFGIEERAAALPAEIAAALQALEQALDQRQ
jgi:HPt (histidine-containing phosphotransfer) domain-containing protein